MFDFIEISEVMGIENLIPCRYKMLELTWTSVCHDGVMLN